MTMSKAPLPAVRIRPSAVCLLLLFITTIFTDAFVSISARTSFHKSTLSSFRRHQRTIRLRQATDDSSDNNKNDSDFFSDASPKEKSSMPGYMASFLNKNKEEEEEDYTHMIGFPLEDCHELLLQLESVQRAVIYHCPVLVRSAIVPVMTRLPMLYVDARQCNNVDVTKELHNVVKQVVKKRIQVKVEVNNDEENDIDVFDESEFMRGPNEEGYRPLVLTFEKLEMDGEDNEVLLTTAKENDGNTETLRAFQRELQQELHSLGYKTSLPPDPTSDTPNIWRPRVPFMRLPEDFDKNLPEMEEDDELFRKPEEGGNGISPIFWCQWWDDVFSQNTRLREIGVYARSQATLNKMDEKAFYYPHETISLPNGNAALTKDEERHKQYQESRLAESEKEIDGRANDDDIPDASVQEARTRLEDLYKTSLNKASLEDVGEDGLVTQVPVDELKDIPEDDDDDVLEGSDDASKAVPDMFDALYEDSDSNDEKNNVLDDWTRERIRKAVEGRGSVKAREAITAPKPPPPPIEENPVFLKYREERDKRANEPETAQPKDALPPFPSREHFVGAWNLVSSPIPSEQSLSDGDESKSDNLILRVDGTTFGGPVLDREFMHKAAGGTWKMITNEDDDETQLRVRLVVPPSKERILVMQGQVKRLLMPPSNLQPTRNTFGIPLVEQAVQEPDTSNYDDILQCDGKIWVEDARTGANRNDLGEFTLMKVENQNPNDYVITIPRSVRNQD